MTQQKSPSPGGTRGKIQKSVALDSEYYPAAAGPVKGYLCRACMYFRDGMAGKRPNPVCVFTGERITDGLGCDFFRAVDEWRGGGI
ncbi:hypothetical protein LJC15_01065 [Desulfovibrio sp. OttesenSCG-928-G11]|nr:hypothetical protein [Desulfovibrio sp. OttesenSCG-928-G11]